mgnify:CR=1 FL=1
MCDCMGVSDIFKNYFVGRVMSLEGRDVVAEFLVVKVDF